MTATDDSRTAATTLVRNTKDNTMDKDKATTTPGAVVEEEPVWEVETKTNIKTGEVTKTGNVVVFEKKGNKFHLCTVLRKYTGAKMQFQLYNGKRTPMSKIPIDDLWDALGLLRALKYDVEQYNSVVVDNKKGNNDNDDKDDKKQMTESERDYRTFRLTRQAAAMGVRLQPIPVEMIEVVGLDSLMEHIEAEYKSTIDNAKSNIDDGMVDFESLSEYFKPGSLFVDHGIGTGMSVETLMKTRACYYSKAKSLLGTTKNFYVAMEVVVATGNGQYAVVEAQFPHSNFDGTRSIYHSYDMFTKPTEYQLEQLRDRGIIYQQICGGKSADGGSGSGIMVQYDAGTFTATSRGSLRGGNSSSRSAGSYGHASRSSGRMMVDTLAAWGRGVHCGIHNGIASDAVVGSLRLASELRQREQHQRNKAAATAATAAASGDGSNPSASGDYTIASQVSSDYNANKEMLLLSSPLPESVIGMTWPVVPGFSLQSRTWGVAMVHGTSPVQFNDKAFDSLVMSAKRKKLIQALVKSHEAKKRQSADVITGKGEGSIFLLHGPPGVGKTLTAEAISELLHKPLYVVSMGELGTSPEALEDRLQDVLDLCVPWKALVLIDEAEMLLERRTKNDILRNAMVCVMLRLLEYYSGILFLTTNRVESLDPAFQSRVTCALRYDPLSVDSRKEIWVGALQRLNVDMTNINVDELAKVDINGRQIKNVLQLAVALAQNDDVPVTQEHLETTLDVTTSFLNDSVED